MRGRVWVGVVAVAALWVFTAVLPLVQFVEARTVPSGTKTQSARVVGYDDNVRTTRSNSGLNGRIVRVELADETRAPVYLDYRLRYPDTGDRLSVYRQGGELRSTAEGSIFELVTGTVLLFGWPAITTGYLRSTRRTRGV